MEVGGSGITGQSTIGDFPGKRFTCGVEGHHRIAASRAVCRRDFASAFHIGLECLRELSRRWLRGGRALIGG